MKQTVKTTIALSVLVLAVIAGFILDNNDRAGDLYPGKDTEIRLYGEAHGFEEYYELEYKLWQERYEEGDRDLFVELPYYSAEFLNIWMEEDSDDLLDIWFREIADTQSGNEYYRHFLHQVKENCPGTVFWGTDVGHQYDTTGIRYLEYLKDHGLQDTENYRLAEECIRQGQEFYEEHSETGMSDIREGYMISNFTDAYTRCGGGKVMGIYGSYHTDLSGADVMALALKEEYGDKLSSVKLSTLAMERDPYEIGFNLTGIVFLLMLFIPNIIWAKKKKPEGYEEYVKNENKVLLAFERTGEVLVTTGLAVFRSIGPNIKRLPEGLFFDMRLWFWIIAFVLMILYECFWIRYFRSKGTMKDYYSSYAGFPLAGATLPVIAVFLLGIYSRNLVLLGSAVILGIGHIGIHLMHSREAMQE